MATIANFQPQARLADPHQEGLPNYAYLAGLLAMLVGIGMYMFYRQTAQGLGITGLNRPVQWGIYVANFIFCVGLSAGGIAISAMAHTLNLEKLKTIAVVAEAMAISFLILAGIFITLDLGRPDRIYFLLLYARLTSPLLWDVIVINSYLVLCSALLFFSVRPEMAEKFGSSRKTRWLARLFSLGVPLPFSHGALEVNHKVLRILAIVSIPGFVALHSVTAWILGLVKGQAGWNTTILAPLFIVSALVAGMAGLILNVLLARWMFKIKIDDSVVIQLGKYLFLLIPVLMYFLFSEYLTVGYSGTVSHVAVLDELLKGRFSGIFWFDVIVGLLIPLVLLGLPWTRTPLWIGLSSFMVVIGVFTERLYILLPSLMTPNLPVSAIYSPSNAEWTLMVGTYSLGLLMFIAILHIIYGFKERRAAY